MPERGKKERESGVQYLRRVGMLALIPFVLGLSPLVGYFLGFVLEQWLGYQKGWLRGLFLILGFAAGIRETYRIIKLSMKENK